MRCGVGLAGHTLLGRGGSLLLLIAGLSPPAFAGALQAEEPASTIATGQAASGVDSPVRGPAEVDEGTPSSGQVGGEASGVLRRVAPIPVQEDSGARPPGFRGKLNEAKWIARLQGPDLAAREQHLDELLRRARIDPYTQAFVWRLAESAESEDLRWTARLALRLMGPATHAPLAGMQGDLFSLDAAVEGLYSEMLSTIPDVVFSLPSHTRLRIESSLAPRKEGESDRKVIVRQGPQGTRVVLSEEDKQSGEGREHVFEGSNLAEILQKHPRLAREVDVPIETLPGIFEVRVEMGSTGGNWHGLLTPFAYGDRWREGRDPKGWFRPDEIGDLFSPQRTSQPVRTDILGVRVRALSAQECRRMSIPSGLMVMSLERGTIAHSLGVTSGDVLLRLDGSPMLQPQDLTQLFEAHVAGTPLVLLWIDDLGQRQQASWQAESSSPKAK